MGGLAVAGGPWLAVCAANDWCYDNEYGAENMLRTTALVTAAIGAGLGALYDLSRRHGQPSTAARGERGFTLSVSPALPLGAMVRVSATL